MSDRTGRGDGAGIEFSAPAGRQIVSTDPDFTMLLPADFRASQKLPPGAIYFWQQFDRQDRKTGVFIVVEPVPELAQVSYKPFTGVDLVYTERWQGWDISVFVSHLKNGDQTMITRNAAVPLKGTAIKIQVSGPESADAQMDALIREILAGLQGQTNWVTPEVHKSHMLLYGLGFVGAAALVAGFLVLRKSFWDKRRRQSAEAAMHMPED